VKKTKDIGKQWKIITEISGRRKNNDIRWQVCNW